MIKDNVPFEVVERQEDYVSIVMEHEQRQNIMVCAMYIKPATKSSIINQMFNKVF